jgi:mRNA interferase RelE/StbE
VRSYRITIGSRAAKELKGGGQLWRIRVGDYRIVYSIDDDQVVVDVIGVPHRSKAYR